MNQSNVDPLQAWIKMDNTWRARALLKIVIYSKLIRAKWLACWCLNRIASNHMTVDTIGD